MTLHRATPAILTARLTGRHGRRGPGGAIPALPRTLRQRHGIPILGTAARGAMTAEGAALLAALTGMRAVAVDGGAK